MSQPPFRIHLVDDDPAVRNSLRALLVAHRLEVLAAASAEEFLATFDPSVPGCLLLDLRMPGMSGLDLQSTLRRRGLLLPVIILTGHGDVPVAVRAMKAGAVDFLEKPVTEAALLEAIAQARLAVGQRHLPPAPSEELAQRLGKLTVREREVLDYLVRGLTNKSIAGELGISQRTVEIHRARIREKLEARGLADLIRITR